jgi:hypothetical protein
VGNLLTPLLGGVLYEKTGYADVFGIGLAVLGVDFVMRLLVIEKKVAKRYDVADLQRAPDLETTPDRGQDSVEPGEAAGSRRDEEPLLGKEEEQQHFRLSKDQPALAR